MVPSRRARAIALLVLATLIILLLSVPPKPTSELLVRDVWQRGFTRAHPELCLARGAGLHLLVLVATTPEHAQQRDAIRLTWGHYRIRSDVTVAFIMGAAPEHLKSSLAAEDTIHGDLMISYNIDTFSNLTLTTISMLEWTVLYCPLAPFLLKVNDNVFVNIEGMLRWIAAPARAYATRAIWGRVCRRSQPQRAITEKYYVLSQFPESIFPYYISGSAYVMTADCVKPLLEAALGARYQWLEDAFLTDVIAMRLNIARRHDVGFSNNRDDCMKRCMVQRALTVQRMVYHEQFELWLVLNVICNAAAHGSPVADRIKTTFLKINGSDSVADEETESGEDGNRTLNEKDSSTVLTRLIYRN